MSRREWNPYFDHDYRRGLIGENLVGTFLEQLSGGLIEVKTDHRVNETGNIYIETWQEKRTGWEPSGVNISEANFYAIAGPSGKGFIVISTDVLKEVARSCEQRTISTKTMNTVNTRGRLVPVSRLIELIFGSNDEERNTTT